MESKLALGIIKNKIYEMVMVEHYEQIHIIVNLLCMSTVLEMKN